MDVIQIHTIAAMAVQKVAGKSGTFLLKAALHAEDSLAVMTAYIMCITFQIINILLVQLAQFSIYGP